MMSGGGKSTKEIPSGSRKMVQSLKEIVNFASEFEIYAILKECNMDPNEAVHRLLSQDTFHEVKSKREKKKETKDTPEFRSRSMNNNSSRAARSGTERGVWTSSGQTSSYDYGVTHGKPVPKKENGTNTVPSSLMAGSATAGSNLNRKSTILCEAAYVQNTSQAMSLANGPSLPSQPPSGFQHNWSRMPGQMSMADIVRMGRPQVKVSSTHTVASDSFHASCDSIMSNMSHQTAKQPPTITPSDSDHEFNTSQDPISHGEEKSREVGVGAGNYNSYDDWSLAGQTSAGTGSIHPEISGAPTCDGPSASSSFIADEYNVERHAGLDENQIQEGDVNGECSTESVRTESISDREDSVESSHPDDDPLNDMSPYQTQRHAFEQHGVEDVDEEISSATANLPQLNLQKGESGAPSADDNPAVIIPIHLQVTNADCSHLSFGSFGSGGNATLPGSFPANALRSNLEMAPLPEDTTHEHLNTRNPEYYDGDQLKSTLDENVTSRTSTSTISYDIPSASQPEMVRDDTLATAHGPKESFPSGSDYAFSAVTQPTATYTYPDSTSQMQNLSHFSSLMQPYTNSLPSSLLASTAPPLREYDLPFSALLPTQSMPTKYNTATPSVSGPISMPEQVKPEVLSSPQPTPHAMPSSNIPQHLQMHPYSQPTLPLGHFANMIGYPFLPQSYTYLPSAAFQQAYAASNSPFHQSQAVAAAAAAAAMKYTQLPQYKTSISGSNLAQSPALPPGYGGFTSSTNNIPGSFSLNPATASANTSMGFEEALSSQYKEGYLPLQHNDNSAMWVHGAGSRSVSAHLGNTYYGFQGQQQQQNQLNAGFRQAQQLPSSQYGPMGYLNLYQSQQGGPAQEQHQQQNPSEGNLSGSQGQIWQHGY